VCTTATSTCAACVDQGGICHENANCCSGSCNNGVCACLPMGEACSSVGTGQCCGGACVNGTCQCAALGDPCAGSCCPTGSVCSTETANPPTPPARCCYPFGYDAGANWAQCCSVPPAPNPEGPNTCGP
jgi:hypothetical protein